MPFKVFQVDEVLTAADVNEYLAEQAVMTFADSAARGSAIGSAVEGMVTYLEDTDQLEVYGGTATGWVSARDSVLGSAVAGDTLTYDGTDWVNGPRSHNAIINGDFGIWQRGTSFTSSGFTADRWRVFNYTAGSTFSREQFSTGDIEAIGYGDAEFFLRADLTGAVGIFSNVVQQRIEDARTFAGQQVTLSFWVKADAATSDFRWFVSQDFAGGSANVDVAAQNISIGTSWQRYSFTFTMDSVSGKTINSGSYLSLAFTHLSTADIVFDLWGVQLEAGPVATPFKLAGGGSKAAELALCQRYYQRYGRGASGRAISTTEMQFTVPHVPELRRSPTSVSGNLTNLIVKPGSGFFTPTAVTFSTVNSIGSRLSASGITGLTTGDILFIDQPLDFDAEL